MHVHVCTEMHVHVCFNICPWALSVLIRQCICNIFPRASSMKTVSFEEQKMSELIFTTNWGYYVHDPSNIVLQYAWFWFIGDSYPIYMYRSLHAMRHVRLSLSTHYDLLQGFCHPAVFLWNSSSTILLHIVFGLPGLLLSSGPSFQSCDTMFLSVFPHYMTNPVTPSASDLTTRSVHSCVLLELLVGNGLRLSYSNLESSSCTCIGNSPASLLLFLY